MLLVKTKIGPSRIAGMGLFADEVIPKGTVVWKFAAGFDQKIDKHQLAGLSEVAKEQFLNYAYFNPKTGKYILCFDDARYFNHSDNPNTEDINPFDDERGTTVATRDIAVGEEITCNYQEFDGDFGFKMQNVVKAV